MLLKSFEFSDPHPAQFRMEVVEVILRRLGLLDQFTITAVVSWTKDYGMQFIIFLATSSSATMLEEEARLVADAVEDLLDMRLESYRFEDLLKIVDQYRTQSLKNKGGE